MIDNLKHHRKNNKKRSNGENSYLLTALCVCIINLHESYATANCFPSGLQAMAVTNVFSLGAAKDQTRCHVRRCKDTSPEENESILIK